MTNDLYEIFPDEKDRQEFSKLVKAYSDKSTQLLANADFRDKNRVEEVARNFVLAKRAIEERKHEILTKKQADLIVFFTGVIAFSAAVTCILNLIEKLS